MEKDLIHLGDWQRILIGEVPAQFFIEVVLRLLVVYFILIFSMRAMGKRMASQLTRTEYAALVSMAAATGMAVQTPERGLLPAILIAIIIILLQRWIAKRAAVNNSFEIALMGKIDVLIEDGKMNLDALHRTRITRERLFAELRGNSIRQMGEIQRFYFEAGGDFALIKAKEPKPGLSVLPNWDKKIRDRQQPQPGVSVCKTCGNPKEVPLEDKTPCNRCGNTDSEFAVL